MNNPDIPQALLNRLAQAEEWVQGKPCAITDLQIRNCPCQATPIAWIDEPARKERHGVRFTLAFTDERSRRKYEADVEVRVNPQGDPNHPDLIPCVVFYALDSTGAGDAVTWFYINERNLLDDLPIEEWFRGWLVTALGHGEVRKVLAARREV